MKILIILKEFLKQIEKNNPYSLIIKGGTALSIYYLNYHRESEDLDFDAPIKYIKNINDIQLEFIRILDVLKQKRLINDYNITKAGFAQTNRYHIKLDLKTYKIMHTKIDIDFVDLPKNLIKRGNLNLYPIERLFVTKSVTFTQRKEFKDLYDIHHLIKKIDYKNFKKKKQIVEIIFEIIKTIESEDIKSRYKTAFRNVDLNFKNLKESQIGSFIQKTKRELNILINKLRK